MADAAFIDWLKVKHEEIMNSEKAALALLAKGDKGGYRQKMQEKANILANLAAEARPYLSALPPEKAKAIDEALRKFSDSAATSLALDSVFYMSALLYPDDHKKGDPDNLMRFIHSLESN